MKLYKILYCDLVLGLLYGVFIELPLLLLNAIFGINLVPLVMHYGI